MAYQLVSPHRLSLDTLVTAVAAPPYIPDISKVRQRGKGHLIKGLLEGILLRLHWELLLTSLWSKGPHGPPYLQLENAKGHSDVSTSPPHLQWGSAVGTEGKVSVW